jgi:hypothetical protein
LIHAIERLLEHDTAGDPMGSGLKWTRKTTRKISRELGCAGITVSPNTVGRLLQELRYGLRVNHKKHALHASHPDRNRQFDYIATTRRSFQRRALPSISVDTKKKELVGRFKNPGAVWAKAPIVVNDHDFRSDALGMAIPYGIYDIGANQGHLFVGTSHDTPAFAADAIAHWWVRDGRPRYPKARRASWQRSSSSSSSPTREAATVPATRPGSTNSRRSYAIAMVCASPSVTIRRAPRNGIRYSATIPRESVSRPKTSPTSTSASQRPSALELHHRMPTVIMQSYSCADP